MNQNIAALVAGILFGIGLAVSQMINPAKVIGFLDIFGRWDPSLVLVMAGAVVVAFVGFRLVQSRSAPLFGKRFELPTRRDLDSRLIGGAAIFGIGWGLTGFCPGPAIASLAFGDSGVCRLRRRHGARRVAATGERPAEASRQRRRKILVAGGGARVERVLQTVAQEVEGDDRDEDHDARPEGQHGRGPDRLLGVGQHIAPARRRRLNA